MSSIFQLPGLHTDTSNPGDVTKLREFKWIVQQTQNGTNPVKSWDLRAYRDAGYKVGVWGVLYTNSNLVNECKLLLDSAIGADVMVLNVEHRMSVTDAEIICNALRQFTGPKALITIIGDLVAMKAAIKVFLDNGWDIIGEMYLNDQENLTAKESEWQAQNANIPRERYSHALGMYLGVRGRWVTGAEYAQSLTAANAGKRISLWMVEQGPASNWDELSNYLRTVGASPEPDPPPVQQQITLEQLNTIAKREIIAAAMRYEVGLAALGIPIPRNGRIPHAKRICIDPQKRYPAVQSEVKNLLESIGA
jgi:hypothetical protein